MQRKEGGYEEKDMAYACFVPGNYSACCVRQEPGAERRRRVCILSEHGRNESYKAGVFMEQ